jgi:hypothetical protein
MIADKRRTAGHARHADANDRMVFGLLLAISYPICLAVAILRRLTGMFREQPPYSGESVFTEAKSAAYAAVGYAFHA